MEQELQRQIDELKNKLSDIEGFVSEKKRQQLSFPLDINTEDIIKDKKLMFERNATGTVVADKTLVISINGKLYQLNAL